MWTIERILKIVLALAKRETTVLEMIWYHGTKNVINWFTVRIGTVLYNIILINLYRKKINIITWGRSSGINRRTDTGTAKKKSNLVVLSGPAAVRPRSEHRSGGSDPVPALLGLPYTGEFFFKKKYAKRSKDFIYHKNQNFSHYG